MKDPQLYQMICDIRECVGRIDERTEGIVETQGKHDTRIAAVENKQSRTARYYGFASGVGAGVGFMLANAKDYILRHFA